MTGKKLHKQKKRICGVFMIIAALAIMQLPVTEADAAASASDFVIQGSTLTKYRGSDTNVSVPDTVETIGENAFEGNTNIELVVLPNSVKSIEPYAFWGCDSLDTVVLGKGLKAVGDYAFAECKGLEQMTIPPNVGSIGIQAFADCVSLTDISIPSEVTDIHETAFEGCAKLTIHCDAGSTADKYAQDFYERQKEMVQFQEEQQTGGTSTGSGASSHGEQGMTSEDVPVQDAPSQSTEEGSLLGSTHVVGNQAVVFMDHTSQKVFEGSGQTGEAPGAGADGASQGPANKPSLPVKYTLVDGKTVADQAYYKSTVFENLSLPQGIEEIGRFSFARSSLKQIVLPEGVTDICYGAFYHCDNLAEISLPDTVSLVEPKAFAHSAWVDNFRKGTEDFLISGGVLAAYKGNASKVVLPEGVRVIAGEVFQNHSEITSVVLPESLISIGEAAFEGCSSLSEIQFAGESGLESLRDRAFAGCAITEATLPASVKSLGTGAFDNEVQLHLEGETPERTHEASAGILSNEAYRNCSEETEAPGVKVTGLEGALAVLEDASRAYTLSVSPEEESILKTAYERSFQAAFPENAVCYDLELFDNSGISLTDLSGRILTVTFPVPEGLTDKKLQLYAADRNGQLEAVESERVSSEGRECLRFVLKRLSSVAVCGQS